MAGSNAVPGPAAHRCGATVQLTSRPTATTPARGAATGGVPRDRSWGKAGEERGMRGARTISIRISPRRKPNHRRPPREQRPGGPQHPDRKPRPSAVPHRHHTDTALGGGGRRAVCVCWGGGWGGPRCFGGGSAPVARVPRPPPRYTRAYPHLRSSLSAVATVGGRGSPAAAAASTASSLSGGGHSLLQDLFDHLFLLHLVHHHGLKLLFWRSGRD